MGPTLPSSLTFKVGLQRKRKKHRICNNNVRVSIHQDGTCIIYTARKGEYVVTLRPMGTALCTQPSLCHVTSLALSEYGNIVVVCKQESNRALCRYSINGKPLSKDVKLKEDVADVLISGEYIVTGGTNGRLEIRELHRCEILARYLVCLFVYFTPQCLCQLY